MASMRVLQRRLARGGHFRAWGGDRRFGDLWGWEGWVCYFFSLSLKGSMGGNGAGRAVMRVI